MNNHPYQLILQDDGLFGLAVYSPVLGEFVEVPSEFLEYELARIGDLLNTPPLDTSPVDAWNGSMPSTASRGTLSSASAPSSDPPFPSSSPTNDQLDPSIQWASSQSSIRRAPSLEVPKAAVAAEASKPAAGKVPGWERREVACLACRKRKCRCEGTHAHGSCDRCFRRGLECKFEPIEQTTQAQAPGGTGVSRPTKRARVLRPAPYGVEVRPRSTGGLPAPPPSLPLLPALPVTQPAVEAPFDETAFNEQVLNDPLAYGILLDVLAGKLVLDT